MIVIIDYNCGNVGSISNMLKKIGIECEVSSNPNTIFSADKLILPGVGSFDNGMNNLKSKNLIDPLNEFVHIQKKPILGICLGMQLMSHSSEEGIEQGLSWIDEPVVSFRSQLDFTGTIPVMGWNYVNIARENLLLNEENKRYYFVHSYFYKSNKYSILNAQINEFEYCAAFQKDNLFGVQFHPEKSHKFGMELLRNFCSI
jgi:imidazole glycerol-phosphate synthase subunit HisH